MDKLIKRAAGRRRAELAGSYNEPRLPQIEHEVHFFFLPLALKASAQVILLALAVVPWPGKAVLSSLVAPHEHPLELAASTEGSCRGVPMGRTLHGQPGTKAALLQPKPPGEAASAAGGDAWGNPALSSAAGAGLNLHGKSQGFPRANSPAPHSEQPILQITRYLQRVRAKNNGRPNPSCVWEIGRATR